MCVCVFMYICLCVAQQWVEFPLTFPSTVEPEARASCAQCMRSDSLRVSSAALRQQPNNGEQGVLRQRRADGEWRRSTANTAGRLTETQVFTVSVTERYWAILNDNERYWAIMNVTDCYCVGLTVQPLLFR